MAISIDCFNDWCDECPSAEWCICACHDEDEGE